MPPCQPIPPKAGLLSQPHLEGAGQLLPWAGQCSQDGRGGGADVGAQSEGVGSFDADHTQAWGHRGGVVSLAPPSALSLPAPLPAACALTDEWSDG